VSGGEGKLFVSLDLLNSSASAAVPEAAAAEKNDYDDDDQNGFHVRVLSVSGILTDPGELFRVR
jgi:hypothetical protein